MCLAYQKRSIVIVFDVGMRIQMFGRPELCMINKSLDFVYERHRHRLTEWNENLMNPENLQIYDDTDYQKGATLSNCFGFVQGTVRPDTDLSHSSLWCKMATNGFMTLNSSQLHCPIE